MTGSDTPAGPAAQLDLDLRLLRYFVMVADLLHFGRAAERLHVSQPALSQQIRRFEDRLGVRLFDRDRRSVALTDAGRALLGPARAALVAGDQFAADARRLRRASRDEVVVGFHVRWPYGFLPRVLRRLATSHPEVVVRLTHHDYDDTSAGLRDGSSDVALLHLPIDIDDARVIEVAQEDRVAIVAADHDLAGRDSVTLTALVASGTPWAIPRTADPEWLSFWGALAERREHGLPETAFVEVGSHDVLLESVASGAVLALAYRPLVELYRPRGVVAVDVEDLSPGRLGIGWIEAVRRPAVTALLAAVTAELGRDRPS